MTELLFRVEIAANLEVRDADGNLVSSEPIQTELNLTEAQLEEMGIPHPVHPDHENQEN